MKRHRVLFSFVLVIASFFSFSGLKANPFYSVRATCASNQEFMKKLLDADRSQRFYLHNEAENMVYALSSYRSGTWWLHYILTHAGGSFVSQVGYVHQVDKSLGERSFDLTQILSKTPVVLHSHFAFPFANVNQKFNKTILLIRDYHESLGRFYRDGGDNMLDRMENYLHQLIKNVRFFETFSKENRLLVFYEDLMLNPEEQITKMVEFIGGDLDRLPSFFKNFDVHFQKSLAIYDNNPGPAISRGKNLHLFKDQYSEELIENLRTILLEIEPELTDKYFSRYF